MMNCLAATFFIIELILIILTYYHTRYIIGNKVSGVHSKKYFWQTLQNFLVSKQNSLFLPYDLYEGGERICLFLPLSFFYVYTFVKDELVAIFVNFHVFFSPLDLSEGGAPRVPGPQLRG